LLVSIFLGGIGVDRFMLGQTGMGIGKLLTCGGFGLWWLIDLFLIMGETKKKNFFTFSQVAH
jgi:TM2 domain-containing membrane protein YozV